MRGRERGVLLPEGLMIAYLRESGRKYTRLKTRGKLIAKSDKFLSKNAIFFVFWQNLERS
jgi:hypothetical protein